jgi:hypothetical protein
VQTENFACIYKIYGISEEGMSNLKFPGEGIFMLNWKFRGGGGPKMRFLDRGLDIYYNRISKEKKKLFI